MHHHDEDHDHDHGHHDHDYDHLEADHESDGHDVEGVIHNEEDPAEEGSRLHLEIHRAVDELGKYALEIDIASDSGIELERLVSFVDDLMRTSTEECIEHGADLIGHIKSFLRIGDGSVMFSMVDPGIPTVIQYNTSEKTVKEALLVMHVIVHGIWDDVIRECTLEVLPDVADRHSIPYALRADYYDTEKSIAHHEKR